MDRFFWFVIRYPRTVIAVTVALTILLGAVIATRGIDFNGSPQALAGDDESLSFYKDARASFGDDRVIVVGITSGDVFTVESVDHLRRLSSRLSRIQGVSGTLSLTNVMVVRGGPLGLLVEPAIPDTAGLTQQRLIELRESLTRDPLYAGHYVSEDGGTAAITVLLEPLSQEGVQRVAAEVERIAAEEAGDYEVFLAGIPIMEARGVISMMRDFLVLSPVAALLCFFVFAGAFRSFWGAAIPMVALMMGLVCTLGVMSLAGRSITIATLSLPTVLLAIGSSYIFHSVNQYRLSVSAAAVTGAEGEGIWFHGLRFIGPALIVSGATTMAGFGALATSSVPAVRDMGLFESLGVGVMLLLSLTFVPAVLAILPEGAVPLNPASMKSNLLTRLLRQITALVLHRRKAVIVTSLLATALVAAGVTRLKVNTDYLNIFPESSDTVRAARAMHERLAGAATVLVVLAGKPGDVATYPFLLKLAALERYARRQPGVDASISVAGIVERFETAAPDQTSSAPRDDHLSRLFEEYLLQDESLSRLVRPDMSAAVVVLRTNLFSSDELKGFVSGINEWSRVNVPAEWKATPTGAIVLLNNASDAVAASQTRSLVLALAVIYLMMVVLFRSFATGLLALVPNLLPIAGYFGFLGWSGIPLDITTSLIATAVLGLAVDNSVHMIRRWRQSERERGESRREKGWALWLTMARTGKPMVLANLMLIAAFLVFILSSFRPVRTGGLLWAVTIFSCLVADLVFLPALMTGRSTTPSPDDLNGGPTESI